MAKKPQIWFDFVVNWSIRVLMVIEQVDLSADRFCSYDVLLVLRHVSSSVDFALVVDLDID